MAYRPDLDGIKNNLQLVLQENFEAIASSLTHITDANVPNNAKISHYKVNFDNFFSKYGVILSKDGIYLNSSSNTIGTVSLVGGTATVNTIKITNNSVVFLTHQDDGDGTIGTLYLSAVTVGTSFTITSTEATDTSTVGWLIINTDVPNTASVFIPLPRDLDYQRAIECPLELYGPGNPMVFGGWDLGPGEKAYVFSVVGRNVDTDDGFEIHRAFYGPYAIESTETSFCPRGTLSYPLAFDDNFVATVGFVVSECKDVENVTSLNQTQQETTNRYQNLILIDDEIISFRDIENLGPNAYRVNNVYRGVLDTVPANHSAGAEVYFLGYGGFYNTDASLTSYVLNDTPAIKFLPYNEIGTLGINEATANNITIAKRAWLPYPPGGVSINGDYFPECTSGINATIGWKLRDRIAQTYNDRIYAQTDADVVKQVWMSYENTYYVEAFVNNVSFFTGNSTTSGINISAASRIAANTDCSLPVVMNIWATNADGDSAIQTRTFVMTGLGMPLGLYLGGCL